MTMGGDSGADAVVGSGVGLGAFVVKPPLLLPPQLLMDEGDAAGWDDSGMIACWL